MPISIVDLFLVEHDLVWVKASEVKVVVVMARKPMMDNCMVVLAFDVYLMLRLPPNITKMYLLKRMQRRCLSASRANQSLQRRREMGGGGRLEARWVMLTKIHV